MNSTNLNSVSTGSLETMGTTPYSESSPPLVEATVEAVSGIARTNERLFCFRLRDCTAASNKICTSISQFPSCIFQNLLNECNMLLTQGQSRGAGGTRGSETAGFFFLV